MKSNDGAAREQIDNLPPPQSVGILSAGYWSVFWFDTVT